mgnify:CR=1 FL=1|jgi:hypothetical protein
MNLIKSLTRYAFYTLLALVLFSCSNKNEGYFKKESITTKFKVTDVYKAKYSKVKGYIIYNGIKLHVDNGVEGYYYKDYNLRNGQTIDVRLNIYYYSTAYGYELVFGDVDVSRYVMN